MSDVPSAGAASRHTATPTAMTVSQLQTGKTGQGGYTWKIYVAKCFSTYRGTFVHRGAQQSDGLSKWRNANDYTRGSLTLWLRHNELGTPTHTWLPRSTVDEPSTAAPGGQRPERGWLGERCNVA